MRKTLGGNKKKCNDGGTAFHKGGFQLYDEGFDVSSKCCCENKLNVYCRGMGFPSKLSRKNARLKYLYLTTPAKYGIG